MKKPTSCPAFSFFRRKTLFPAAALLRNYTYRRYLPAVSFFAYSAFGAHILFACGIRPPPHPLSAFKQQRRPFHRTPPFSFALPHKSKKHSSTWPEISGIQKNFKQQRRPFRQTPPFSFDLSAPKKTLLSLIGNFRDTKNSPRGESFPTRRKSAFSGCCRYL